MKVRRVPVGILKKKDVDGNVLEERVIYTDFIEESLIRCLSRNFMFWVKLFLITITVFFLCFLELKFAVIIYTSLATVCAMDLFFLIKDVDHRRKTPSQEHMAKIMEDEILKANGFK